MNLVFRRNQQTKQTNINQIWQIQPDLNKDQSHQIHITGFKTIVTLCCENIDNKMLESLIKTGQLIYSFIFKLLNVISTLYTIANPGHFASTILLKTSTKVTGIRFPC